MWYRRSSSKATLALRAVLLPDDSPGRATHTCFVQYEYEFAQMVAEAAGPHTWGQLPNSLAGRLVEVGFAALARRSEPFVCE